MRCLINYARQHAGAGGVDANDALERAAGRKAGDVMRLRLQPHGLRQARRRLRAHASATRRRQLAVGREPRLGQGQPRHRARSILQAWLNSPPHRATMLRGSFEHIGIGLKRGGFGAPRERRGVWVLQIGCRAAAHS